MEGLFFLSISSEITYIVQDNEGLSPTTIVVTDGEKDALPDDSGEELLSEKGQEGGADEGEVEIVDEEERLELEGLTASHQLSSTEDYNVVYKDKDGSLLQGRHGSLSSDELEVVSWVARNELEGLAENGP